jgi:aconitate hydratase
MPIFEAAMKYKANGVPLVILAGKDYGCGSSRDWAAKGPQLLGVRAVLAESYERIHRSNLVGMGILPLQFQPGESAEMFGLSGHETFDILGVANALAKDLVDGRSVRVRAWREDGTLVELVATVRIDTLQEMLYYEHGGVLRYVLRELVSSNMANTNRIGL